MRSVRLATCAVSMVLAGGGCAEPFDTPPAYESARYLCDDDGRAEWQALVDQCREADASAACAGVVSFAGSLEAQEIVVESTLRATVFEDRRRDAATTLRDNVAGTGLADYFQFTLGFKSIGGGVDSGDSARELTFGAPSDAASDELADDYATGNLRLSSAGSSVDLVALRGALAVSRQLPTEQAGSFWAAFGTDEDVVTGCFHLFPTETRITEESTQ